MAITMIPSYCYPTSSSNDAIDFNGHVLIVPVVSHACIPQLAVDLLIHSAELKLQRVARLDATGDLIPFVGCDEGGKGGLTTPLEVYSNASSKVTMIQQRSPVLKARRRPFSKRFTSWVRSQGFSEVLILSSMDDALRTEQELNSADALFHYVPASTSSNDLLGRLAETIPPLAILSAPQFKAVKEEEQEGKNPIPASSTGLTRRYLSDLTSTNSNDAAISSTPQRTPPVGVLLLFAAEGDNRPEAHNLASRVVQLLHKGNQGTTKEELIRFKEPPSWAGLFGNGFDQALFG